MSHVFPPSALVPLVMCTFLIEHVTGQLKLLILVAPCCTDDCCLPPVFNMLEDIPHYHPTITNLVMDVSMDRALNGLPKLH